jgi:dienelactone hydrolase
VIALLAGGSLGVASFAQAAIVTRTITYQSNGTVMEGYLAFDDAAEEARPGVLVVHQWMGLTDNERMRCQMLAELGYVAFAADIYGQGIRPADQEEAAQEAGKYFSDRALFRQRVTTALNWLRGDLDHLDAGSGLNVDPQRVAAIGYCFGGGGVLELARSGADLAGVVSFHGTLDTPNPEDAKDIQCPILVLHGAEDPYVPFDKVEAFFNEMNAANIDYQFIAYSDAVHAFTQKEAGDDKSKGAAYSAKADARSWRDMQDFFAEIFHR